MMISFDHEDLETVAPAKGNPYTSTRLVAEILSIASFYNSDQNTKSKGQKTRINELADSALKIMLENDKEDERIVQLILAIQETISDIHNKNPDPPWDNTPTRLIVNTAFSLFGFIHDYGKNSSLAQTLLVLRSDALRELAPSVKEKPHIKTFDSALSNGTSSNVSHLNCDSKNQVPREQYKNNNTDSDHMSVLVIVNYLIGMISQFFMTYANETKDRLTGTNPDKLHAYEALKKALIQLSPIKKDEQQLPIKVNGQFQLETTCFDETKTNAKAFILETIKNLQDLINTHITNNQSIKSVSPGVLEDCAQKAMDYLTFISTPPEVAYAEPETHVPNIEFPDAFWKEFAPEPCQCEFEYDDSGNPCL
ncbi:MAG: hypothetical protein AB7F64_05205 [Gammaproteobacteria bacterium]